MIELHYVGYFNQKDFGVEDFQNAEPILVNPEKIICIKSYDYKDIFKGSLITFNLERPSSLIFTESYEYLKKLLYSKKEFPKKSKMDYITDDQACAGGM